MISSLTL